MSPTKIGDQHGWFHLHGPCTPTCCWCVERDELRRQLDVTQQALARCKAKLAEAREAWAALEAYDVGELVMPEDIGLLQLARDTLTRILNAPVRRGINPGLSGWRGIAHLMRRRWLGQAERAMGAEERLAATRKAWADYCRADITTQEMIAARSRIDRALEVEP